MHKEKSTTENEQLNCEIALLHLCHQRKSDQGFFDRVTIVTRATSRLQGQKSRRFVTVSTNDTPRFIAKVALDGADGKVNREYEILVHLTGKLFSTTVPVYKLSHGFIMEYISGSDFPELFQASDSIEVRIAMVESVVREMVEVHQTPLSLTIPLSELDVFRRCREKQTVYDELTQNALESLKLGPMHGDLGPWNIRINLEKGSVYFLDWEDFYPVGMPVLDMLNFLTTMALLIRSRNLEQDFRELYSASFEQDSEFGFLFSRGLNLYSSLTSVKPLHCLALLPVFCQYMRNRLREQGRDENLMFYPVFEQKFDIGKIAWLHRLNDL